MPQVQEEGVVRVVRVCVPILSTGLTITTLLKVRHPLLKTFVSQMALMRNAASPGNNSMIAGGSPTHWQVLGLGGGEVPTLRVPSTGNSYLRFPFPLSTQFPKETRGFPGLQGLDKTLCGL